MVIAARQPWFNRLVSAAGLSFVAVGLVAAAANVERGTGALLATAILPPATGLAMIAAIWRWPRLFLLSAALLDLDAVVSGAVFVNGIALVLLLPVIAVGLAQQAADRRTLLAFYAASALAAFSGTVLAVFYGPGRGVPGTYPPAVILGITATVSALVFGFTWWTSAHLAAAMGEATRELDARRATEAELRRTTELLRSILDSSPIPTQAFLADRTVLHWNPASERVFGYRAEEVLGRPLPELAPQEDRAASAKRIARTLDGDVISGELTRRLTKDGQERWIEIYAAPFRGPDGAAIGIAGQLVDVTDRIAVDAELRRTADALRAIVTAAPLGIVLVDLEGVVQFWNPAAERIFGWRSAEAVGRHVGELAGVDRQELEMLLRRAAVGETVAGLPVVRRRRDGKELDVRLFLAPRRDAGQEVVGAVAIIEDTTERKALEAQLRQAQKLETVGQLAGTIAHDFNNLLTAIRGFAELGQRSLTPGEAARADFESDRADFESARADFVEIGRAADRAADLTSRLLAFTRRTPVGASTVEINDVVEGLVPMLQRLVGPTVRLELALDPAAGHVVIERGQLEQAILNLVVNARDAMPNGGVVRMATSSRRSALGDARHPHDATVLTVQDTGTGMTADIRGQVFEPFFTTKDEGEGTGLGLAIVFGVVRAAGGLVSVDSTPGVGSTFRVSLPTVAAPDGTVTPRPEPPSGGSETILLVEDEETVRAFVGRVLRQHGYGVVDVGSAEAARDTWSERGDSIDLLLSDIVMPGLSGIELAEELRGMRANLRVLLVSGYVPGGRGAPALPPDVGFLQKPFTTEELLVAVRSALNGAPG